MYFTEELRAPYNNHRAALVDTEELWAYSQGWMTIDVVDPTNLKELEAEAKRFGIEPIDYRFRDQNTTELRKVFMGAALVYGDKQEVLPIVTQIETLEYDIALRLRTLVVSETIQTSHRVCHWTSGTQLIAGRRSLINFERASS